MMVLAIIYLKMHVRSLAMAENIGLGGVYTCVELESLKKMKNCVRKVKY